MTGFGGRSSNPRISIAKTGVTGCPGQAGAWQEFVFAHFQINHSCNAKTHPRARRAGGCWPPCLQISAGQARE